MQLIGSTKGSVMPKFQVVIAAGLKRITFEMESKQIPSAVEATSFFMESRLCRQFCDPDVKSTQLFLYELRQMEGD